MSCVEVDRSRTITIFCCSIRPTFSKIIVSCLWLSVVHVSMLFLFFTTDILSRCTHEGGQEHADEDLSSNNSL